MPDTWYYGFFELIIVLAFVAGWMVLEWKGRQLDRAQEARERERQKPDGDGAGP